MDVMTQVVTGSICLSLLQQAADPSVRVLATLLYVGPAVSQSVCQVVYSLAWIRSIHRAIGQSINPSSQSSTNPSVNSSSNPTVNPSTNPSSIHRSIDQLIASQPQARGHYPREWLGSHPRSAALEWNDMTSPRGGGQTRSLNRAARWSR